MLQQIWHENIVAFLESFRFQECFYTVLQHVPISLVQIVASPPYPTELQLAAIIGQVRRSLAPNFTLTGTDPQRPRLSQSKDLVHRSLTCSNVLLSAEGVFKIGKPGFDSWFLR